MPAAWGTQRVNSIDNSEQMFDLDLYQETKLCYH